MRKQCADDSDFAGAGDMDEVRAEVAEGTHDQRQEADEAGIKG
jgi:hypothetical protein